MQWRDVRVDIRKIFLWHGYWCTRKDLSGVTAESSLLRSLKRLEKHLSKMTLPKNTLYCLGAGRWTKSRWYQLLFWEPIFILGLSISLPHLCRPVSALRSCFANLAQGPRSWFQCCVNLGLHAFHLAVLQGKELLRRAATCNLTRAFC